MNKRSQLRAINIELGDDGNLPESVELLPAGPHVLGRDGREWLNDRPEGLVTEFNSSNIPLVIDYEHATEVAAPKGQVAPAAGWGTALEAHPDGSVWAKVEWTHKAAEMVLNHEYRFLSPAFDYDPVTKRIIRLVSVALTNKPNLQLTALNSESQQENNMTLQKILEALDLSEASSEEEIAAALDELKEQRQRALNRAEIPDLARYVPRADYDQAVERATNSAQKLQEFTNNIRDEKIETVIQTALESGKITPATADFYRANCRQEGGLERFEEFIAAAPTIAPESGLNKKTPDGGKDTLTTEQRAICSKMMIPEEDYKRAL